MLAMKTRRPKPNWCFVYPVQKEPDETSEKAQNEAVPNVWEHETQDERYSILSNGKLYKKDSREWLHKTRNKRPVWSSSSSSELDMDSEDILETGENLNVFSSNKKRQRGSNVLQKILSSCCERCPRNDRKPECHTDLNSTTQMCPWDETSEFVSKSNSKKYSEVDLGPSTKQSDLLGTGRSVAAQGTPTLLGQRCPNKGYSGSNRKSDLQRIPSEHFQNPTRTCTNFFKSRQHQLCTHDSGSYLKPNNLSKDCMENENFGNFRSCSKSECSTNLYDEKSKFRANSDLPLNRYLSSSNAPMQYKRTFIPIVEDDEAIDPDMFRSKKKPRTHEPGTIVERTISDSECSIGVFYEEGMREYLRRNCNFVQVTESVSDCLLNYNRMNDEKRTDLQSTESDVPICFSEKSWGKRAMDREELSGDSTSWRESSNIDTDSTTPTPSESDILNLSPESSPTEPKRHRSLLDYTSGSWVTRRSSSKSWIDSWDTYASFFGMETSYSEDNVSQDVENLRFENNNNNSPY